MATRTRRDLRLRRHRRVRRRVQGTQQRPRLAVFRSSQHIYAQLIDDVAGRTLAAASDRDSDLAADTAGKAKVERAGAVGTSVARKALAAGVSQVVFDRGGFLYHGRVKALADAARAAGLSF